MAGNYPDVPGRKFPIEVDGTAMFVELVTGSGAYALTQMANADLINLNKESGAAYARSGGDQTDTRLGLIFPEFRDIVAIHTNVTFGGNTTGRIGPTLESSVDTTTGADGVWTSRTAPAVSSNYRTGIQAVFITGVKALRWYTRLGQSFPSVSYNKIHIYGAYAAEAEVNRLRFWHPTLDQELVGPELDYGNVGRGATGTKTFRIKNNSATLTANSIVISADELTPASPALAGVITFDNAGGGFVAAPNIGALAPGILSGVITQKILPTSAAQLGIWRQRVKAIAGSWT